MLLPADRGNWDIAALTIDDSSSVQSSAEILPRSKNPRSLYEIHSVRCTMSGDGTGILASAGICDGQIPAGLSNTDGSLMQARADLFVPAIGVLPNIWWHWPRSAQHGQSETVYLPPDFFWEGVMHGCFQNAAGAGVQFLWTVIFRTVRFSGADFLEAAQRMFPRTGKKRDVTLTP